MSSSDPVKLVCPIFGGCTAVTGLCDVDAVGNGDVNHSPNTIHVCYYLASATSATLLYTKEGNLCIKYCTITDMYIKMKINL